MTLLFMDGFDHYAVGEILKKYPINYGAGISTSYARYSATGSQGIGMSNNDHYIRASLSSTHTTLILGLALYISGISPPTYGTSYPFVQFANTGGDHVKFHFDADRKIVCMRGDNTVLGTTTLGISAQTWYYFEFKVKVSDTVGTVDLRVNEESWLNLSGIDTANNATVNMDRIEISGIRSTLHPYYDDLYICDDQGTTNNDFLGDVRVSTLRPNGAGTHTDFTPSAGANYENVDDSTDIDDDTTYNSADGVGEKDSYALEDLPAELGAIHGIQVNSTVRKDDAGTRVVKPFVRASGVDYPQGDNISLSDSYTSTRNIVELNPSDSGAWSKSDVDGLESGLEIIS